MQDIALPSPPRSDEEEMLDSTAVKMSEVHEYLREVLPDVDHKTFLAALSSHLCSLPQPVAVPAQPSMRTTHDLGLLCIPSEEFNLRTAIDAETLTSSSEAIELIKEVIRSQRAGVEQEEQKWMESVFQDDPASLTLRPMSPPLLVARRQARPASKEDLFVQAQQLVDLPMAPFEQDQDMVEPVQIMKREEMLDVTLTASASQMTELKQQLQLARPSKTDRQLEDEEDDEEKYDEPILRPLSPPLLPRGAEASPVERSNFFDASSRSDVVGDALASVRAVGQVPTKIVDSLLIPGSRAEAVRRWNEWDDIMLPPDTSSPSRLSTTPGEATTQPTSVRAEPSGASLSGGDREPMSDSSLDLESKLPDLKHDDVIFSSARALPGRSGSAPTLGTLGISSVVCELQSLAPPVEQVTQENDEQLQISRNQYTAIEVAQRERLACPPGVMFWLDEPDLPRPGASATDPTRLPLELSDLLGSRSKKQAAKIAPAAGLHGLNIELPHDAFQAGASTSFSVHDEELQGDAAAAAAAAIAAPLSQAQDAYSMLSSLTSTPRVAHSPPQEALLQSRMRPNESEATSATPESSIALSEEQQSVASLNPPFSHHAHAQKLSNALACIAENSSDASRGSPADTGDGVGPLESPSRRTDLGSASPRFFDEAEPPQDYSVSSLQQSAIPSSSLQQAQTQRRAKASDEADSALERAVRAKKPSALQPSKLASGRANASASMDTFLLMRGQNFKAVSPPLSSPPQEQTSSRKEFPAEQNAPASSQSSDVATEWPQHRYVVTSRMLKNYAVMSSLRDCNVELVERQGIDADVWLDARSACIFFKLSLLPAALSANAPSVADLKSLLQSARHTRVLLVLEQYSSTGNAVQLTPPLQKALAALPDWISSAIGSMDKEVEHVIVSSPAKAAIRCREWGSQLESHAALAPASQIDQQVTAAATWRARETWLTEEPYANETFFASTVASPFAAVLIVAVRGSADTFIHDSLEYKLWQFGNVLSEQTIRQLHTQLQDAAKTDA